MSISVKFNETTFEIVQIGNSNYYNVLIDGKVSNNSVMVSDSGNNQSTVWTYKAIVDETNYFNHASVQSADVSSDNLFPIDVVCDIIKSISK